MPFVGGQHVLTGPTKASLPAGPCRTQACVSEPGVWGGAPSGSALALCRAAGSVAASGSVRLPSADRGSLDGCDSADETAFRRTKLSMVSATNIDAKAVNTIAWLSAGETSIVVPVYQRQYRWDIGGCEQLLADIRSVAASSDNETHFIGSILSTKSAADDAAELVLIDGQQRITTLMLLIAALQHTVRGEDPALAEQLARVLVRADDPNRTKLRPHRAWAGVFESVVLDRRSAGDDARDSRFDDNYAF